MIWLRARGVVLSGYVLEDDHKRSLRWRLYDQILLSPDLIDHIREPPEILTGIEGQRLLTDHGNPDEKFSDHLPVQLRISI